MDKWRDAVRKLIAFGSESYPYEEAAVLAKLANLPLPDGYPARARALYDATQPDESSRILHDAERYADVLGRDGRKTG